MTFLKLRKRIASAMGLSASDTTPDDNDTLETQIKEWVNERYKVLAGSNAWNWLIQDSIIQTTTEITTGTVSITNASTAITFSSGPADSVKDYWIQFEGSDDWYFISTHTAAATAAVLTANFLGTTNGTATYKLRKVYYELPSNIHKILNMRQTRRNLDIKFVSIRSLDDFVPDRTRTGEPEWYSIAGLNSDGNYRVEFYPVPSVAMNITVRSYKEITELSADDDSPIFPSQFHEFLVWDVLATYGYLFLDDTRIGSANAIANKLMKEMKTNEVNTEKIPQKIPFDVNLGERSFLSRLDLPAGQ